MDTYNNFVILGEDSKEDLEFDKEECTMTISSLMSEYNSINSTAKIDHKRGLKLIITRKRNENTADNFIMAKFAT